jgi:hypothetical protein
MNLNNYKMFAYNQCIYKTVCKSDLKRHVKSIHAKIRNIKCNYDLCKISCLRCDTLTKHIKLNKSIHRLKILHVIIFRVILNVLQKSFKPTYWLTSKIDFGNNLEVFQKRFGIFFQNFSLWKSRLLEVNH